MGGANLLSAGPIEAGYFNPATLTQHKGLHVTVAGQMNFNQDFLDLADFIETNTDYFDPAYFQTQYVNPITRPAAERFRSDLADFGDRWYTLSIDPMLGLQIGSLSLSTYLVTRA